MQLSGPNHGNGMQHLEANKRMMKKGIKYKKKQRHTFCPPIFLCAFCVVLMVWLRKRKASQGKMGGKVGIYTSSAGGVGPPAGIHGRLSPVTFT
jgi:hypothetical protein